MAVRTSGVGFVSGFFILLFLVGAAWGQGPSPAQEQEFIDARAALQSARNAQAQTHAPDPFNKAGDFLQMAENARPLKDATPFTRFSRLARAYAELAEAAADLKTEEEKLATSGEELRRIKAEFERLK
jgi:hypothetical protein